MKERQEEIRDLVLTDICPFTLGTGIINRQDMDRPIMSPIIERNSILPTSKTGLYTNTYDFQRNVKIRVYQGESFYCDENLELGEIDMTLSPVREGQAILEVRFSYDINELLQVDVTDHVQHEQKQKIFTNKRVQMSPEELETRLKELEKYKISPREHAGNALVLARGERLYRETVGREREMVMAALQEFQAALSTQNDRELSRLRREITGFFDRLENGLEPEL